MKMRSIVSVALLFLSASVVLGEEIQLRITREPAAAVKAGGLEPSEVRDIAFRGDTCKGLVSLRDLLYRLVVRQREDRMSVEITVIATIEKERRGPMAAPLLIVRSKGPTNELTLTRAFELAMISNAWEDGATFALAFPARNDALDAKFWESAEIRCSASPYRAALIPPDVTYKPSADAAVAKTVGTLVETLKGERRFATPGLYGEQMVLVGPTLYAGIRKDPSLKQIAGPKVVNIDPTTGVVREQLHVKGEAELAAFAAALERRVGASMPRVRAATAAELSELWATIGWDIEEPIVVLDYGDKRLIIDYGEDGIFMIEELVKPAVEP